MADINQEARIPVYINDEQAKSALKTLQVESEKWRKKMFEAMSGGDLKGLKEAERELKKVNKAVSDIKKEAFDVNKVINNIAEASRKDLRQALQAVEREMDGLNRKSKEYKELFTKKLQIKEEFAIINGTLREQPGFFTRASATANKYFNLLTLGIATLTGVVFSIGQFIKGMVGLDDALADVMKTTGLTRKEVRELYTDFRYMNTRTPRKELLALAEEAGRLGKTGKKDIQDFIEVANKIKISLGDDLGGNAEEAIREVGKLTEIYRIGNQYGTDFKESMEKVGSGLNSVANNSNASAEYLIEYLKRLGGISTQAKISAADIMGYASTFDQLGQNVEMAATAQSKVIVDMFTDPAKYARIAKMEVGQFSQLLKTDANEAFIRFLEGLNGNNQGLSEMATKLNELDIDGARAVQALAALSSNTKMLREQQVLSNDSMDKGTSLSNEYAIKNNNLAGSWERLTAFIHSKFINSGFLTFLEKIVGKTAEWIDQPVEAKLKAEQAELNTLVEAATNVNATQENRLELIAEIQKKYPDFLLNLNTEKVTNEELRTRLEDVNKQYEDRILLMIKEDKLQKNYRDRTDLKLEELDLIKKIANAEKIANEARKKIAGANPSDYRSILTQEEFNAMRDLPILTTALQSNRKTVEELKQSETDLNAALADLRKNRTVTPTPVTDPGNVPNPDDPFVPTDDKELEKAFKKATDAFEKAAREEENILKEKLLNKQLTEEGYRVDSYVNELAHLEAKKELYIRFGQDVSEIDKQLLDKKLEWEKGIAKDAEEVYKTTSDIKTDILKDDLKQEESIRKEIDKFLDDEQKKADERAERTVETINKEIEAREKLRNQQIENAVMAGAAAVENAETIEEAGKAILNSIRQQIKAHIAEAVTIAALKALKSVPFPLNIIAATIAGGATAFLFNKLIPEFYDGGYTSPGDKSRPAGIVHAGEYVIPQEGVQNPNVRRIVDIFELARRNKSLARLDLPTIFQTIPQKQFATGGFTTPTAPSGSPVGGGIGIATGISPEEAKALTIALNRFADKKLIVYSEMIKKDIDALNEIDKRRGL